MNRNARLGRRLMATVGLFLSAGLAGACDSKPQEAAKPAEPPKPAAPATEMAPAVTTPASGQNAGGDSNKDANYVLKYTMNAIDGKPVELSKYAGKVVVIVNVASRCGLTPQYETLQKLFAKHEKDGLVILAFPANNFLGQEPGSNADIAEFCKGKYNVTFPLFSKVSVKGDDATPLFKQLNAIKPPVGGEPDWNFTKYLVNRRGVAVARFGSRVRPDNEAFLAKVQELLGEKAPPAADAGKETAPAPAAPAAPAGEKPTGDKPAEKKDEPKKGG